MLPELFKSFCSRLLPTKRRFCARSSLLTNVRAGLGCSGARELASVVETDRALEADHRRRRKLIIDLLRFSLSIEGVPNSSVNVLVILVQSLSLLIVISSSRYPPPCSSPSLSASMEAVRFCMSRSRFLLELLISPTLLAAGD